MFDCPRCHTGLDKFKSPAGVYWQCPSCGGRTATVAFLRKMVPRPIVDALWRSARSGDYPRKRQCPSCRRRMPEIPILLEEETVHIDVCPPCQFIWFDPTEYERLPALAQEPARQEELPLEARVKLAEMEMQKWEDHYLADGLDDRMPDTWWKVILSVLGMPVEENTKTAFRIPFATWGIAATILLISIVAFTDLKGVVQSLGMVPSEAARLGGLTLLTSFFLHAGWQHLLGNLYFLLVFGDNVEERIGAGKFLFLLLVSTVAGDIVHIVGDPRSGMPCIGASGGISGVIAYYALAFPRTRLAFFVWYGWVRMPAAVMFFLWVALQLFGAQAQVSGMSSVSSLAHLGGAGAGLAFWWFTKRDRA